MIMYWDFLVRESTAVDHEGHCLHEGTAMGLLYCCKCGQYVQTTAEGLCFYEQPYIK